jgi:hypothetical protein
MSRVQVEALRIVMMMEDIAERDAKVERLRLAWLGHEWEHIKERFPDYFRPTQTVVDTQSDETEIDLAINQELSGASSEYELEAPSDLSPEQVAAMIAKLTAGSASPTPETDWM